MSAAKTQIQDRACIDLDDHALFFSGKPLDNARTLAECDVRPQSSLELLPRLRGGMRLELRNAEGKKIIVNVEDSGTTLSLHSKSQSSNSG